MLKNTTKEVLKDMYKGGLTLVSLLYLAFYAILSFTYHTLRDCLYSTLWAISIVPNMITAFCRWGMERLK